MPQIATDERCELLPPSTEEVRERLASFCRYHPIQKLEVFGSVARNEQEPGSDVDLMVTFQPEAQVTFERFLEMKDEAQRLLHCPVDLLERQSVEQNDNEIRRRHMLRGVKTIYAQA